MEVICIVCGEKLTVEHSGIIKNQVVGWAGNISPEKYIRPEIVAYHLSCEEKAVKKIMEMDKERLIKMGVIL